MSSYLLAIEQLNLEVITTLRFTTFTISLVREYFFNSWKHECYDIYIYISLVWFIYWPVTIFIIKLHASIKSIKLFHSGLKVWVYLISNLLYLFGSKSKWMIWNHLYYPSVHFCLNFTYTIQPDHLKFIHLISSIKSKSFIHTQLDII